MALNDKLPGFSGSVIYCQSNLKSLSKGIIPTLRAGLRAARAVTVGPLKEGLSIIGMVGCA